MNNNLLFNFNTDISNVKIPSSLNNPFGLEVSEITKIAAIEFQEFIELKSKEWGYDFLEKKGKMFGVLVVQLEDVSFAYLGTASGKLPENILCHEFVPSVFDDSVDDYFINKGMTAMTEISKQIKGAKNPSEIESLKEKRREKSIALQQQLFENYQFLNLSGEEKKLIEIFRIAINKMPPSAAGECAAPKLLQYAIKHGLKPISLAEFWWGNSANHKERKHKVFYPACKDKCKPILEYMLQDDDLYNNANLAILSVK